MARSGRLLVAFGMALWVSGIQAQCPTEIQVVEPISCSGADDAVLTVTTPDGVDPAEVYWLLESDTLFGAVQSGLGPGSYLAFVPGCGTLGINVNEPFPFFISTSIDVLPTCDDPCSGVVTATANFGAPPIVYSWSHDPGESGPTGMDICEGTVVVSAVDANGCADDDVVFVDIPPVEVLAFSTDPSCNGSEDGSASAVATGGLGGAFVFFLDRFARQCGWPWGRFDGPRRGHVLRDGDWTWGLQRIDLGDLGRSRPAGCGLDDLSGQLCRGCGRYGNRLCRRRGELWLDRAGRLCRFRRRLGHSGEPRARCIHGDGHRRRGCVGVGSALVKTASLDGRALSGPPVVSWRCKWHRGGRPSRRNRTHRGVLELAGGKQRNRAILEWRRGGRLHVFGGGRKWLHGVGHPHIGRPVSLGGDRDGDFAQLRRRAKCP